MPHPRKQPHNRAQTRKLNFKLAEFIRHLTPLNFHPTQVNQHQLKFTTLLQGEQLFPNHTQCVLRIQMIPLRIDSPSSCQATNNKNNRNVEKQHKKTINKANIEMFSESLSVYQ